MKKFLLFCAAFSAAIATHAQHSILRENAPQAGDYDYNTIDTLPTVSKGNSGANQTWDFSLMNAHIDNFSSWGNASTSQYAADFPEADLTLENGGGLLYFDLGATQFNWVGIILDFGTGEQAVRLSNPGIIMKFPSAYQATFKDTAAFKSTFYVGQEFEGVTIDSARYTYNDIRNVSYDAYGSLITPAGNFPNTLREKTISLRNDKLEICVKLVPNFPCQWQDVSSLDPSFAPEPDTSVTYSWYGPESTSALASLGYNANEDTLEFASFNNDATLSGIAEVSSSKGSVYPNPAKNQISIVGKEEVLNITITDLQGREVLSVDNKNIINISNLPNGSYIIAVSNKKGLYTDKLIINH